MKTTPGRIEQATGDTLVGSSQGTSNRKIVDCMQVTEIKGEILTLGLDKGEQQQCSNSTEPRSNSGEFLYGREFTDAHNTSDDSMQHRRNNVDILDGREVSEMVKASDKVDGKRRNNTTYTMATNANIQNNRKEVHESITKEPHKPTNKEAVASIRGNNRDNVNMKKLT